MYYSNIILVNVWAKKFDLNSKVMIFGTKSLNGVLVDRDLASRESNWKNPMLRFSTKCTFLVLFWLIIRETAYTFSLRPNQKSFRSWRLKVSLEKYILRGKSTVLNLRNTIAIYDRCTRLFVAILPYTRLNFVIFPKWSTALKQW